MKLLPPPTEAGPEIAIDGADRVSTYRVSVLLLTLAGMVQGLLPVSRHRTESPFAGIYVNEMPVSIRLPFFTH